MSQFTHFDPQGRSRMVDVSAKEISLRMARASACVTMEAATASKIQAQGFAKGNVLEIARLAGIQASKRTDELIPLCHSLPLEGCELALEFVNESTLRIVAEVQTTGKTGVEMEALTAVSIAALTVYDMCKSVDRAMVLGPIQLEEKSGGKSGHFVRETAS